MRKIGLSVKVTWALLARRAAASLLLPCLPSLQTDPVERKGGRTMAMATPAGVSCCSAAAASLVKNGWPDLSKNFPLIVSSIGPEAVIHNLKSDYRRNRLHYVPAFSALGTRGKCHCKPSVTLTASFCIKERTIGNCQNGQCNRGI